MSSLSIIALVAVSYVVTPVVVLAQAQYPPPVPTATASGGDVAVCFRIDGEVDGRSVPGRVDHGSDIIVSGPEGTAVASGQIELFAGDSGRTRLGEARALEDGSFAFTLTLPAWIKPGHHRITGVVEGCGDSEVDLEVLGASVLGTSVEAVGGGGRVATVASGGSGLLPRTGISILSFILGALILIGIGALLLIARNRRRAGSAIGPRANTDTSSESGVALLDTGHFVPRKSGQRGR